MDAEASAPQGAFNWGSEFILEPFKVHVLHFDGNALVKESYRHHEPLFAVSLDDRAFQAAQGTTAHPHFVAWFQSGFGSERLVSCDEPLDGSQIGHERGLIWDRQPAGDRVGGQSGSPLIVVNKGKNVSREERHMRYPGSTTRGV